MATNQQFLKGRFFRADSHFFEQVHVNVLVFVVVVGFQSNKRLPLAIK
jgi:hypothetical protein